MKWAEVHPTLRRLEDMGYVVQITHDRRYASSRPDALGPGAPVTRWVLPRGGWTQVVIYSTPMTELAVGEALCSRHDNFNKHRGIQIALGRALKQLERAKAEQAVAEQAVFALIV